MKQIHQEEVQMQADHQLLLEHEERERVKAEHRVKIHSVANEMREASPTGYLPPISQIKCVMKECYSVFEAITQGDDNQTPCQHCCMTDSGWQKVCS